MTIFAYGYFHVCALEALVRSRVFASPVEHGEPWHTEAINCDGRMVEKGAPV